VSRVLLGHSYFLRFDPKLWRAMQPYPPIGTLYAAALLRDAGHDVHFFDAMLATSTAAWTEMLEVHQPDVAVLFEDNFNYLSKMCLLNMRQAAFEMISAANERGCPVIVCGADVTDHAADYLDQGADFAIIGEGDETVMELVGALFAGQSDPSTIAGVVFRNAAGETVSTGHRTLMRDLDSLPQPARDLIDLKSYQAAWQHQGRLSMNLVASRGCSFHCNWCAKPIWGQRYNTRSPDNVAAEIQTLQKLGADHLWFMDDILGIKPGWLAELATLLEQRSVSVPFKCLSRADLLLRPGEIDALRRAGCETVWIGAESGSQKILDAMEKGTSVEQIREAARRLKDAGIRAAFFLQFGYPGEDWADVLSTFQLVRDCEPDDIGMSVSYPLPGTPFYDRVRDSMSARGNWVDSAEMPMLYRGPYSTDFYHRVHATLHTEFRLRKTTKGSSLGATTLQLLRDGKLHNALSLLKDAFLLPIHRVRLEMARKRSRNDAALLPVALNRQEAGTPTEQDVQFELVAVDGASPKANRER
jgi:radical SAM superfamily enzyme YgiQ (UPF0313 family)